MAKKRKTKPKETAKKAETIQEKATEPVKNSKRFIKFAIIGVIIVGTVVVLSLINYPSFRSLISGTFIVQPQSTSPQQPSIEPSQTPQPTPKSTLNPQPLPCQAKTCANYPGMCGTLDNGCGSTIICNCPTDFVCGTGNICQKLTFSITISVLEKSSGAPIENTALYLDGKFIGQTNSQGFIKSDLKAGSYSLTATAPEGISTTQTIQVDSIKTSFEIRIDLSLSITVHVSDELTYNSIEDADVYLDDNFKGKTDSSGSLKILNIKKGSYILKAIYKSISKSKTIEVSSYQTNFEIKIKAPRTVELLVKDKETENPVKSVRVYLNGEEKGITTQEGTLKLVDIIPDNYRVRINALNYGDLDAGYLNINTQTQAIAYIDMPNPDFRLSTGRFETWLKYVVIDEVGQCKDVRAINTGNIQSDFTVSVCLVYQIKDNKTYFVGADSHVFGSVAGPGQSELWDSKIFDTKTMYEEDVVIMFFDTNEYIPSKNWSLELNIPNSFIEDWTLEAKNWCTQNKEECAKIAGIFVGNVLKTIAK